MESHPDELSRTLTSIRGELQSRFKQRRWGEVVQALRTLSQMGESEGQKEICLRAQSLIELMGNRAGGRDLPGQRIEELYQDLLFHLSHFEWQTYSLRPFATH